MLQHLKVQYQDYQYFNMRIISIFFVIFLQLIQNIEKFYLENINISEEIMNSPGYDKIDIKNFFNLDEFINTNINYYDVNSHSTFFQNFAYSSMFYDFLKKYFLKKKKSKKYFSV